MPGDSYIQLPDNSYIHLTGAETPDQLSALRTKLGGMQTDPLTQQTNAAARDAGIQNPGVSPTPLPGQGQKILGAKWPSPLSQQAREPKVYAQGIGPPMAGVTVPQFIGALAGGFGGSKLGEKINPDNPWYRDIGGLLGSVLGGGFGGATEDFLQDASQQGGINNAIASKLRYPATANQSQIGRPGTVKNILPSFLQRYTIPESIVPTGDVGTPTNPGPYMAIPPRIPKGQIEAAWNGVGGVPELPPGQTLPFPRPLRPLVGSPEDWQSYDQQMNILRPEASDAGTYHAARGSAAKRLNLQQRIGRKLNP